MLLVGNFNIHWDRKDKEETIYIMELFEAFNLHQHVAEATHIGGHLIDIVISNSLDNLISSLISYHDAIHMTLTCGKAHPSRNVIK